MAKKVNPDPKTRVTYHVKADKPSSKAHAEVKTHEMVDVKWESTPSWTMMEFHKAPPSENEYKIFKDTDGDD